MLPRFLSVLLQKILQSSGEPSFILQPAFPNDHRLPSQSAQSMKGRCVSRLVTRDFGAPVTGIMNRVASAATTVMTVPETAMNKN